MIRRDSRRTFAVPKIARSDDAQPRNSQYLLCDLSQAAASVRQRRLQFADVQCGNRNLDIESQDQRVDGAVGYKLVLVVTDLLDVRLRQSQSDFLLDARA